MPLEGRRIVVTGTVQGVGFRPWVFRIAREAGISGRVRNDGHGVVIEAFGTPDTLERFLALLAAEPPPAARIDEIAPTPIAPEQLPDFVIVASEEAAGRRVSIPPDLATCEACFGDVADPANRRFRYPFTNCTNCGPRFTITRDVPYDRATTTMAPFVMCAACRAEYESPHDRRFHAEPNACPACGPALTLLDAAGARQAVPDPLAAAATALRAGLVVAVKGLGGFHLACDARSSNAVATLRRRKRRDEKPLAVMAADLDEAERLAVLSDDERRLLESVERPIVLVARRDRSGLAPEVSPRNRLVGLMLPYTPLHRLLLAEAGGPLVMTSGNLSDEPLAVHNDEAVARLGPLADVLLVHDRDIDAPCDDSVVRVIAGRATVMRRARGFVPRPIRLRRPVARPVLAVGGLLKNAVCLASGDEAWLGPHLGDLDNVATLTFFDTCIARMRRFLRIDPEVVAHDLHPDYASTRWALDQSGLEPVGVQHHHAHIAGVVTEHRLDGPVFGLAWDGTGYGPDGTSWGGELLLVDGARCDRLATLRPVALPGGDVAVRQVWRLGLVLLADAFGDDLPVDGLEVFRRVPPRDVEIVRQMLASSLNAPLASGAGRYFDGVGALVLGRTESRFEGQVAMELNDVAHPFERGVYPFGLDRGLSPWQIDLRPTVRSVVTDLAAGASPAWVSARFHNTLVAAGAAAVRAAAREFGTWPVALSGGCFQNPRLAEGLREALAGEFAVHLHRQVPPGDGGLALGQVAVAAARMGVGG